MKNVIYKIRNVVNGKFYIGSTVDSRKRFWAHRKSLRLGNHDCIYLQRAWDKYGEDCFKFEVVEQLKAKEELYPAEQKWLSEHFGKKHCYNCSSNADTPMRNASPELKAKHAQAMRDYYAKNTHPRQGKKHTPETLAKIAANRTPPRGEAHYRYGKTVSEETRKKIGDAQRGVAKGPRTYTEEGRAKIRAAAEAGHYDHWKGRHHTEESKAKMGRQIIATDPEGNQHTYATITILRKELGLTPPTVNRALKSGVSLSKGKATGWSFKYA